jgi:hypothetical protein
MYLKIILIVFQCFLPGFSIYRLTAPTTYAMSDLVHVMTHIQLINIDAYGTQDISIITALFLGDILYDTLKLTRNEVEIGLQSCMLKRCKIFLDNSFVKAKSFFFLLLSQ